MIIAIGNAPSSGSTLLADLLDSLPFAVCGPEIRLFSVRSYFTRYAEVRIDDPLVELSYQLPAHLKIHRGITKVVLREAMRGIVPDVVRRRQDELGFPTPGSWWFRDEVADEVEQILRSRQFKERGYVQPEAALALLERRFIRNHGRAAQEVKTAIADSYHRLLSVAMETEIRLELKQSADEEAIAVFAENLRELLLAAPLGQRRVLALDPGFRTGCKLAVLDAQGNLLHHDTIYPHTGGSRARQAGDILQKLVARHEVEAVAIGNGTAGRETESFVRNLDLAGDPVIVMVNEAGASVYSASEAAREEFPDHDLTVRGAVSIGRRLMDPLAELVKIDPKSIGVGQYQHDVDQKALKRSLDDTVASCVNAVGVDLNTASKQLLTYVSGLGPVLAGNIVAYRAENGAFTSRAQLKKVPRLGAKAFEQAAGFLRIRDGRNPLDGSAVHPESYDLVKAMARDTGCSVAELIGNEEAARRIRLQDYVSAGTGLPTLRDILAELIKPGRDPRAEFEIFSFADGVARPEDLDEGMLLPGIVTNVTNFGAFIDVGVHQDGLAHISQLADRFVRDPNEVVKVGQKVVAGETILGRFK